MKCKHCQRKIPVDRNSHAQYCSNRCKKRFSNKLRSQKNRIKVSDLKNIIKDLLGNICTDCGSPELLEIDHVIPVASGGKHELGNLQLLCNRCHILKSLEDNKKAPQ